MSLLDDAQSAFVETAYSETQSTEYQRCRICGDVDGQHADGCIAPKIVAALEAAERLVEEDAHVQSEDCVPLWGQSACISCGAVTVSESRTHPSTGDRVFPESHADKCPWQALVAALKGETMQGGFSNLLKEQMRLTGRTNLIEPPRSEA